jgi:dTDP-4-amino-4,6-dideoxygalactose transaminase
MSKRNVSPAETIAFIDLRAQRLALRAQIDAAIDRVLDHGQYIMGPEVALLEGDLGALCGAQEVISCANGTDALALVLMGKSVGRGDAVLCPSFTFAATAEVVAWVGATPVFVDVSPETFNTCPSSLEKGINRKAAGSVAGRRDTGRSVRSTRRLRLNRTDLSCARAMDIGGRRAILWCVP